MIVRRRKVDNSKSKNFHFGSFLSSIFGNIVIILTAIITGIVAGLLFFYLSMYLQAKKVSTILPSYINMDSKKAEQELKKMGVKVVVLGESGKVIKMDPLPGRNVKLGREIKLFTENIKMAKIVLPDFKYSWYKTVERIMKELNISTSIKVVDSNEIYGTVLSTLPEPGKEIASSQNIVLYISSGRT
ncbi:MAG: PASTA domain-containing protein, partial [Fervidobacterium sp.]